MNIKKRKLFFVFFMLIVCLLLTSNITHNTTSNESFLNLNTSAKQVKDVNNDKFAYLTFDDGPTYIVTGALLDVLKKENVKATFFVVGKEIQGKEKILKRIYDEGHSIGLHTYSHNFNKIYRSTEIFIDEMISTSTKIEEITGFNSKIIRFPGGSAKHLTPSSLEAIHKSNFKIYDWNVNTYDGINPNLSPTQLLKNSQSITGNKNQAIILMHCNFNNKNTIKALPEIIEYYRNLGYEFKTITSDTPEYYYRIRK